MMEPNPSAEIPFRLLTAVVVGSALGISIFFRHRADRVAGAVRKRGSGVLLVVLRAVGLLAILPVAVYLADPRWVAWARWPVPGAVRGAAAVVALVLVPVLLWVFRSIGVNISPSHETREGHRLVTHGPYRYIRHPLYTTGALLSVALALLSAMWWPLAWLGPALLLLAWRTPREEARLIEAFGDEYRDYMKLTGRYLPRLGSR